MYKSLDHSACCFITVGSTGLAGEPGATGATGQAVRNRSTTTQSPCFGPRGKHTRTICDKLTFSLNDVMEIEH